jgi:tRNA(adenine34) deaminase
LSTEAGGEIAVEAGGEIAVEAGGDVAVEETPDERWMRIALAEAEAAALVGDVPVGAVVVDANGTLVGRGRNGRERDQDPTGHAEVYALRDAAVTLGHWRLEGTTVYVTLEPCPMCAGALVNARVSRLVYGCGDLKAGAVDTLFTIGQDPRLNHRFAVTRGVLEAECAGALRRFFGALRAARARSRAGGEAARETEGQGLSQPPGLSGASGASSPPPGEGEGG